MVQDHGQRYDMVARVQFECFFESHLDTILDALRAVHSMNVINCDSERRGFVDVFVVVRLNEFVAKELDQRWVTVGVAENFCQPRDLEI